MPVKKEGYTYKNIPLNKELEKKYRLMAAVTEKSLTDLYLNALEEFADRNYEKLLKNSGLIEKKQKPD